MRYVLFDLDGTLTDPGEGITNSVTYALEKFGISVTDKRELFAYIGPPLLQSFQQLHGLDERQAQQALAYYREFFRAKGMFQNTPYDGIDTLLQRLQNEGYRLMIATSKPEEFTVQILRHFDLEKYFVFVAGNTLDESRPTKAAVIAYIKERYPDICGENALMIGDRKYDVEGAGQHGLDSIGVLYGYGTREELIGAGAAALAKDLQEVYTGIKRMLPG